MVDSPPATRSSRPRWRDLRLLLGVLLVMTSVVVGSRVLAGAERTELVWTAGTDLAAGTRLTADDLRPRAVRLGAVAGNYLAVSAGQPIGAILTRPMAAGDLVPLAALDTAGSDEPRRQVTVPVASFHFPHDLARGRLVDVYVTPGTDTGISTGSAAGIGSAGGRSPQLLVANALVVAVEDGGSSGFNSAGASIGVVLAVDESAVAGLVAGLHEGPIDLVRVAGG